MEETLETVETPVTAAALVDVDVDATVAIDDEAVVMEAAA